MQGRSTKGGRTTKRAAELREYSDDHHHGLVQARRLKRGAANREVGPVEESAKAFLDFWQKDTSIHFRKEEEVLLPVLARYEQDVSRGSVADMLGQHARIRGLVMQLSDELREGEVRPETLRNIGELLETHIRVEEREVFPMIEETLSEDALKEVASRLTAKEAGPRSDPWVPSWGITYDPWPGPGDSEGGGYDRPTTKKE